jgi:hypothetical protein
VKAFDVFLGSYWAMFAIAFIFVLIPLIVLQDDVSVSELYELCEPHKGVNEVIGENPWSTIKTGDHSSAIICKDGHVVGVE